MKLLGAFLFREIKHLKNLGSIATNTLKLGWKTLWEKEKMLVITIFSFSHSVLKKRLSQDSGNSGFIDIGMQSTDGDTKDPMATRKVTVYTDTHNPRKAWHQLAVKRTVDKVTPLDPSTPVSDDKIRFVCMSDTHGRIQDKAAIIPNGDVLLHAGDITNIGAATQIKVFDDFLARLPHKLKIVIAGNHDLTFDDDMVRNRRDYLRRNFFVTEKIFEDVLKEQKVKSIKELLSHCIYLEDSEITVCGIKIYGSPWQPEFCDWGFNLKRGEPCLEKWDLIPEDTDILITHGPPIGHGDKCFDGNRAGCVELLTTIEQRVRAKYHIFGHIHEGYGCTTDGHTVFINASTCNLRYNPINPPIVFDFPIPEGHTKDELLSKGLHHKILVRNKTL